ncbi:MAG: DUF945 domain-containing protein [Gammaproteobacteria bacterium]|nr:DUF945 domain-containing protein [Gammaproteobacteria bacterium]
MRTVIARTNSIRTSEPLSETEMRLWASSIYADDAHHSRSERYVQIPTSQLLAGLKAQGFEPFHVAQAGVRHQDKMAFAKHVVRLRHKTQLADESINEIVLLNSHDGSSSYRMLAGCFRFVCANGMVCGETFDEVRVTHRGDIQDNVINGAYRILEQSKAITASREAMQAIQLSIDDQQLFAQSALQLRFPERYLSMRPDQALRRVRFDDTNTDLWTTLNVVQEHLIKGGLTTRTPSNRLTRTRAIKGIDANTNLNCALWTLAENMKAWIQV